MVTEATVPVLDEEGTKKGISKIKRMETFKSINYIMMIPVLTKALQEQQQTIQELQNDIAALKNIQIQSKTKIIGYTLSQNVPNPFSDKTIINYTLSNNNDRGVLMITDLNGKMLLQYNLAKGSSQQIISGNTLNAGIYIYSLVINGNEIISKRMVLTKKIINREVDL